MPVTKKRVEAALEGVQFLSISQYHTDNNDVWKLEAITDTEMQLIGYKHGAMARLPFASLSDKKSIEQLKNSILQTFSVFVSAFDSGVRFAETKKQAPLEIPKEEPAA